MSELNKNDEPQLIEEEIKEPSKEEPITLPQELKVEKVEEQPTSSTFSFKRTSIIYTLLTISVALLLVAVYFNRYPPEDKPDPNATPNPETIEYTPLPVELTDLESATLLVNKNHPLPAGYVPSNLVEPYVNSNSDVIQVNKLAESNLRKLISAAKKDKVKLVLNAGYISYETQEDYYLDRVSMVGELEASRTMPMAGYSEHQTGLAFDFTDTEGTLNSEAFAETDAGKWLAKNAYKYGFILRYPKGKEDITGYTYMPWHYRYVGVDVAKAMVETDPDITMEEYFKVE